MAERVNDDRILVLIDMKQHTESHALQTLALRPAPIQVAWLGFPGGVGGGLVDYLVGDPVVSPVDHAGFFLESLAFLPTKV
ncbi:O-GlcNAc transferase [Baffinella frigidus]|nr:O-GlcNAc transferase [Cryptophyta sp. CCMP2293]